MKILVKKMSSSATELDIEEDLTVHDLKCIIFEKLGLDPDL